MEEKEYKTDALSANCAYQLADIVKTVPQLNSITPRWLTRFLGGRPWTRVFSV
jgi:hypothetical protein